ncbi:MAG: hypothetical protein A2076_07070 [Geobacteraceae bacterium GWC2_53_11]|nr:MAG: hypothetical protein A2076_07070 [Geobacteraceae bacterium GWC2_53_11]
MHWYILGVGASADTANGDKLLSAVILMACVIMILAGPALIALFNGRGGMFYQLWTIVVAISIAVAGLIGVICVAVKLPIIQTSYQTTIISFGTLLLILFLMKFSKRVPKSKNEN